MTNEKNREDKDDVDTASWDFMSVTELDASFIDKRERMKVLIGRRDNRIRTEAYREGYLDGCSVDGTQTERDRATVAEAVKAERERIAKEVSQVKHSEIEYSIAAILDDFNRTGNINAYQIVEYVRRLEAILSDDQEANRG